MQPAPYHEPDVSLAASAADDPVPAAPARDIGAFFADDGKRRQDIGGFEDMYADIVHYIIRCTHRIWEEGGIGLLYTHYAHNLPFHTTEGTVYGRDAVIASTQRTQAAYPDLRLFGDEVIWAQNGEAYHSSHRLTHSGTNLGWSVYGPPTGRRFRRLAVAHCVVRDNFIVEEWLARDELALIRALGLDEEELARRLGAAELEAKGGPRPVPAEVSRLRGQLPPEERPEETPEGMEPAEHLVRAMFHRVWNWRRLDLIGDYYSPAAVIETSTARKLHGPRALRHHILEWLGGFSDIALTVCHTMSNKRAGGVMVATRWRLDGIHDGPGRWGEPTGRRISLLGFSHHLVAEDRISAEWTVFDEFALLKQIHAPDPLLTADPSAPPPDEPPVEDDIPAPPPEADDE